MEVSLIYITRYHVLLVCQYSFPLYLLTLTKAETYVCVLFLREQGILYRCMYMREPSVTGVRKHALCKKTTAYTLHNRVLLYNVILK